MNRLKKCVFVCVCVCGRQRERKNERGRVRGESERWKGPPEERKENASR